VTNTTGLYPRLKVDTTTSGAVGQAGGVLLTDTIAVSGLGRELSAALSRWRRPLAIHDPAKVITDLAVTLTLGGTAWPTSPCCVPNPASTGGSRPMRRSRGPSTPSPRTPGRDEGHLVHTPRPPRVLRRALEPADL
jgi:hypothetical protein